MIVKILMFPLLLIIPSRCSLTFRDWSCFLCNWQRWSIGLNWPSLWSVSSIFSSLQSSSSSSGTSWWSPSTFSLSWSSSWSGTSSSTSSSSWSSSWSSYIMTIKNIIMMMIRNRSRSEVIHAKSANSAYHISVSSDSETDLLLYSSLSASSSSLSISSIWWWWW